MGPARVFDTSLNEEGHHRPRRRHGDRRADAGAGDPVPQICRAGDRADQRLRDDALAHRTTASPRRWCCRIPGGFFKCGDPWHSQTNEVAFVHNPGWQVAVPSNAEDAVGLLRTALRGNDPVIFFEHRAMLDDAWARRPYPGDGYVLPFGRAKKVRAGRRHHHRHLGRDGAALRGGGEGRLGRRHRPAGP